MITIPPDWKKEGQRQAKAKKLSFSEYLRALIFAEARTSTQRKLSQPYLPGGQSSPKKEGRTSKPCRPA